MTDFMLVAIFVVFRVILASSGSPRVGRFRTRARLVRVILPHRELQYQFAPPGAAEGPWPR